MEENALHAIGDHSIDVSQREKAISQLIQHPITIFNCPSRRPASRWPISFLPATTPKGAAPVMFAARSDYAANAGDQNRCEIYQHHGPESLHQGDHAQYQWPSTSDHTGVIYLRSEIRPAHIDVGMSNTYLLGEKHLYLGHYTDGNDHGDDWSMYAGYQDDNCRCTARPPLSDSREDTAQTPDRCRFGSAHPGGCTMAMCDGSIRFVSYDVFPFIHKRAGNRQSSTDRFAFWR